MRKRFLFYFESVFAWKWFLCVRIWLLLSTSVFHEPVCDVCAYITVSLIVLHLTPTTWKFFTCKKPWDDFFVNWHYASEMNWNEANQKWEWLFTSWCWNQFVLPELMFYGSDLTKQISLRWNNLRNLECFIDFMHRATSASFFLLLLYLYFQWACVCVNTFFFISVIRKIIIGSYFNSSNTEFHQYFKTNQNELWTLSTGHKSFPPFCPCVCSIFIINIPVSNRFGAFRKNPYEQGSESSLMRKHMNTEPSESAMKLELPQRSAYLSTTKQLGKDTETKFNTSTYFLL